MVAARVGEKVPVMSIPCMRLVTLFAAAAPRSTPLPPPPSGLRSPPLLVGPVRNQRGKFFLKFLMDYFIKSFFFVAGDFGGGVRGRNNFLNY